jgi:glutathione peroxidase
MATFVKTRARRPHAILGRRAFMAGAAFTFAGPGLAQQAAMSGRTAYSFTFPGLHGGEIRLGAFAGKPLMVVNTASFCGYASQFDSLQTLWQRLSPRGFAIVGVPSNDFGGQEAGSSAETAEVAHSHGVTYPMAARQKVKGQDAHPFYRWAAAERPRDLPQWNFHKYLIGTDGQIAAVFPTAVDPSESRVVAAIEKEFARVG